MDIDAALRKADPMADALVTPLSPDALSAMKELTMQMTMDKPALDEVEPMKPKRSRRRIVVLVSIATMGVGLPVAALTGGIHTGFFPGANDTESVRGEEYLNVSDPAIIDVVKAEAAQVPLPAGASYDAFLARYPVADKTLEQRGGIRTGIEFFAQCRWYEHWLSADAIGRERAAKVIADFANWQFMKRFAPGDAGPQLTRDLIAQVQRGDDTLVRQYLLANC